MSTTLLLLPGLEGTGRLFTPLQAALADEFEIVVIAYRDEQTFDEYVQSIASQMADTDNVLIAESFSGPIALALLARYPTRIRCAVLCATFATSPFRTFCSLARLIPTWAFRSGPLRRTLIRRFALNGETHHEILQEIMDVTSSVPAYMTKSRLAVLSLIDLRPVLNSIHHPVLYLQASRDRVVSKRLSHQLIEGLSSVNVRVIDGPHMLAQTRPRECANAIKEFLLTTQ